MDTGKIKKTIVLVGMMGSGKTTLGKELKKRLDLPLIDMDEMIEERAGVTIPEIFAHSGESGFRQREHSLLKELLSGEEAIISTGGGVVMLPQNRELLKKSGAHVVYLKITPQRAYARTKNSNRPLLQTENPLKTIENLLAQRDPLYSEVSTLAVDTESGASAELIERMIQDLAAREAQKGAKE